MQLNVFILNEKKPINFILQHLSKSSLQNRNTLEKVSQITFFIARL